LALASAVAWRASTALVRVAMEALMSSSPMAGCATEEADGGEEDVVVGGGETEREGEDRRDRDTKLSRASAFRVAGPRLRSS
jgi:hypothetical protein